MKKQSLLASLILSVILTPLLSGEVFAQQKPKNTYTCVNYKGKPTTVVDTPRGKIQLIVWESDYFRHSGWNPQKRCQEVTKRFQEFSDKGTLKYVTTGKMNKYPVICVGKQVPGGGFQCQSDGLLITLQANDNPDQVLRDLFTSAAKVGGTPITRGKTVVSITQFIDNAPVIDNDELSVSETQSLPEDTSPDPSGIKSDRPPVECHPLICE